MQNWLKQFLLEGTKFTDFIKKPTFHTKHKNLAYMYTTGTEFDDLTKKFPLKHIAVLSLAKSLVVNI